MSPFASFPVRVLKARLEATDGAWTAYLPDGVRPKNINPIDFSSKQMGLTSPSPGKLEASSKPEYQVKGVCVAGKVWPLAQDPQGCREVQFAIDSADEVEVVTLAKELEGHIWEATCCPHANHVLQKLLEQLQPQDLQFVLGELLSGGLLLQASKHKYGCRIVQRLLERCQAEQVQLLVSILTPQAAFVACHPYGNYVIQKLLRCCHVKEAKPLRKALQEGVQSLGHDPYGTAVLSCAMQTLPFDERVELARALAQDTELLVDLACSRHGHQAAKAVVDVLTGQEQQSAIQVFTMNPKLQLSKQGRLLVSELKCARQSRTAGA